MENSMREQLCMFIIAELFVWSVSTVCASVWLQISFIRKIGKNDKGICVEIRIEYLAKLQLLILTILVYNTPIALIVY